MRGAPAAVLLVLTVGVVAGAVPREAAAQFACRDNETFDDCWNRAYAGGVDSETSETARSEADSRALLRLLGKTTGLGGGIGGILGSAIEDFLPLFAGSAAIDREDPEDGVLAGFELNLPAGRRPGEAVQPPNFGGTFKMRVEVREPGVFAPLSEAVPEERRKALADLAERELDDLGDLSVTVAWNRESRRFGRSYAANADVVDGLLAAIVEGIPSPSVTAFQREWIPRIARDARAAAEADSAACSVGADLAVRMRCLSPGFRDSLEAHIAETARIRREYKAIVDSTVTAAGFYRIADLINNQPQLSVSLDARLRDELAGPREYGLEVRYENGWSNLDGLRGFCSGAVTPACYRRYLDDPGVKAALRRSDRLWLSGEVRWVEGYEFRAPGTDGPPDLALDESLSLVGEVGYGRYVAVDESGAERARFDFSAKFARHDGSSGRNDTWGVSAIYTHRISDAFSLPVGVTYSNQDVFLDEVDNRVTATLGLHYRLVPASP